MKDNYFTLLRIKVMKDKLVFTHKNFKKYKSMNNTVECLIKERKVREYIFGDANKKGKRRR